VFAGGPKRTTRTLPSCEAETTKAGSHEDPCEAKLSREGATYLLKRIALTQSVGPFDQSISPGLSTGRQYSVFGSGYTLQSQKHHSLATTRRD